MAQRHIVYLKRSAAAITPEEVLKSITEVEWYSVAVACGVPQKWIDEADENLRIENDGGSEFQRYQLHYRGGDERAVCIERCRTQEKIEGAIGAKIDELSPNASSTAKVRSFLEACVDTVSASYGSNLPGESMAPILGSQVCLGLAQRLDGIIRDPRGDWYEPTDGLDLRPM